MALTVLLGGLGCNASNATNDRADLDQRPEISAESEPAPAAPPGLERLICPECVPASLGGETSDFGEPPPPDPCDRSQPSSIGAVAADALGYGAALAALAGSFDLPLEWTPQQTETHGDPSSGYSPRTQLRGTTQVVSIERVPATPDGCEEHLRVGVETELSTADGALSIAGRLEARLAHDAPVPRVFGRLDLSQARGTLELDLNVYDDWLGVSTFGEAEFAGSVFVAINFWPSGVRASLSVSLVARDRDSHYTPLVARAPIDACDADEQAAAPEQAGPLPHLRSMLELRDELKASFDGLQPFMTDAGAQLTVEIGPPADVCWRQARVSYLALLRLTTDDGRVRIEQPARGVLALDETGSPDTGSLEIRGNDPIAADLFETSTGISGIDFGTAPAATWHATATFSHDPAFRVSGEIGVTAVEPVEDGYDSTDELFSLGFGE